LFLVIYGVGMVAGAAIVMAKYYAKLFLLLFAPLLLLLGALCCLLAFGGQLA